MSLEKLSRADLLALDDMLGAAESFARSELAKASTGSERDALLASATSDMASELADYFAGLAQRLGATIAKADPIDWDPAAAITWSAEDSELRAILLRWWTSMSEGAFAAVTEQLGVDLRFDLSNTRIASMLEGVGTRVVGITETSRALLQTAVGRATQQGLSVDQLARSIRDMVASWGSTAPGEATSRAWRIAATETATAYNSASLVGYVESGLVETVHVYDGADCGWTSHDDPDLANGSVRTLEEAQQHPISHPHCQRALGPVVAE